MRRNLFDDLAVLFFRFIGDYFRVRAGEVSNSIQKKQNNIVAIVNRFLENLYIYIYIYMLWTIYCKCEIHAWCSEHAGV